MEITPQIPIERRIIRKRGGLPRQLDLPGSIGSGNVEIEEYRACDIDIGPRMAFILYYYNYDGYIEMENIPHHSVQNASLSMRPSGYCLTFSSDSRVFVLQGGDCLRQVLKGLNECTLEAVYGHDARVWPEVGDNADVISRVRVRYMQPIADFDDDDDEELPGERPLS